MEEENLLSGVIELKKYDLIIPFICHKCGECCHNFVPQISAEDLPKIALYLNKPQEEVRIQHEECYKRKFTGEPANCSFLNKKNYCTIYPLRPEGCRLYPFTDFGACGVNCPGHDEFYRVVDAFFAHRIYAALHLPGLREFSHRKNNIRIVPNREWPRLLRKFKKTQPSDSMMREFYSINKLPK